MKELTVCSAGQSQAPRRFGPSKTLHQIWVLGVSLSFQSRRLLLKERHKISSFTSLIRTPIPVSDWLQKDFHIFSILMGRDRIEQRLS